jgi:hypothetical protein
MSFNLHKRSLLDLAAELKRAKAAGEAHFSAP